MLFPVTVDATITRNSPLEARMAQNYISLEEAAKTLGISAEELNRMREQHELSGYRDGSTWKFKTTDIERIAEQRASQPDVSDSGELFDLSDVGDDDSDEMVLLSEKELGQSDPGTSSTIIGRPGKQSPEESDIRIITDDERAAGSGSDVELVVDPSPTGRDSDVKLVAKEEVQEEPAAAVEVSDEDSDFLLELDQESALDEDAPSALDESPAGSDIALGSDISLGDDFLEESLEGDLILDDEDDSDFALSDEVSPDVSAGAPIKMAEEGEEDEDSAEADTGDLVFGSPGGSDITLGTADSGISLADPSESGLSLEEPFQIAPLDGAEEEEEISLEMDSDDMLSLTDEEGSSAEVEANEDFLLTPMDESVDEESDDSGSQVIALDESSDIADAAMFDETSPAMGAVLEEDVDEEATVALEGTQLTDATAAAAPALATSGQATYSVLNIVSLSGCIIILTVTGIMMFDLMRNMWSWDSPYYVSSTLMDFILGFLPS